MQVTHDSSALPTSTIVPDRSAGTVLPMDRRDLTGVAGPPCSICDQSAYSASHEPYLVDDLRERARLWRCSLCGTLWCETLRGVAPIAPGRADEMVPGWREAEAWLTATTLRGVLVERAAGRLDDDWFALALLRHEALSRPVVDDDQEPLLIYSGPDSVGGPDLAGLETFTVAWLVGRTAPRGLVVLDPWSPWRCELEGELLGRLGRLGRATFTDAERVRELGRVAPEQAARIVARLWYIGPQEALRHCRSVPAVEAVHFWQPLHGGRQLLVGWDGTVLAGPSEMTLDELVTAFGEGRRTDPALVKAEGTW